MITNDFRIKGTAMLPTDNYYRGYRLSRVSPGDVVHIYFDADFITTADSPDEAKKIVDEYHNAK